MTTDERFNEENQTRSRGPLYGLPNLITGSPEPHYLALALIHSELSMPGITMGLLIHLPRRKLSGTIPILRRLRLLGTTALQARQFLRQGLALATMSRRRTLPVESYPIVRLLPILVLQRLLSTQSVFSSDNAATIIDKNCQHLRTTDKLYLLDDLLSTTLEHAPHPLG